MNNLNEYNKFAASFRDATASDIKQGAKLWSDMSSKMVEEKAFSKSNPIEFYISNMPAMRLDAINKAFEESTNKNTFKALLKKYVGYTASGIKECPLSMNYLDNYATCKKNAM